MWFRWRWACSGWYSTVTCIARKPSFPDLLGDQPAAGQAERADGLVEFFQRHAGVDQGAQHHVAANAAETVKIGDLHEREALLRKRGDCPDFRGEAGRKWDCPFGGLF